jgi:hypothetical protein
MSRTTRLLLAGTALLLAGCGVWFGLTPKAIHIAECGSPFSPEKAGLSSEAAEECAFALDKRYAVLWWVFIAAAVLGLTAVVGGRFTRAPHAEDPGVAKRS